MVSETVTSYRGRLTDSLSKNIYLTSGLKAFVKTLVPGNQPISDTEFSLYASLLSEGHPTILSLQLAPDGVVTYIYPLEGNEEALGLRLLEDPNNKEAALRAVESRKMIIAGPFELLQGTHALVSRMPIYTSTSGPDEQFWGFATVIINFPEMLRNAGFNQEMPVEISLRGQDALGSKGDSFYGDPTVFEKDPVISEILLPEGSWEIAAIPKNGWTTSWAGRSYFVAISSLFLLTITFLVWFNQKQAFLLMESEQRFRNLAAIDGLTGLANRRQFDNTLQREWKRCARQKNRISLVFLDIDHFKSLNDRYGHTFGDECIKAVSKELQKVCRRPADLAARYGGEEFAIILPDTSLKGAVQLADETRTNIEMLQLYHDKKNVVACTISAGVASMEPHNKQYSENNLIEHADSMLYKSKEKGRNRVSY